MSRSLWKTFMALAAIVAALALSACGGDDDEGTTANDDSGTPAQSEGAANVTEQLFAGTARDNIENPTEGAKKGGKLTVLSGGDVDYMDPQKTYYTYAIGIINAIHRGLYAYPPGPELEPVPDLADGMPEISEDGKTVTVKIKKGVMFSKPVSREVTSKDVRYGIERAFTAAVGNGYARIYLGDIVGVPKEPGAYKEFEGITTPDDQTIVFKLTTRHRRRPGRLARDADLGPRAEGVRGEVRRQDAVHLRRGLRGLHRPVHGRVRRPGQGDRLRAGQAHPPGPQPGVQAGRRLPSRLPGRDRHPGRQRGRGGREPAHPDR